MTAKHTKPRVLAIYPYRKGFSFALFEGVDLLDWGLARIQSKSDDEVLVRVQAFINKYSVSVLATEDGANTRRGIRSRSLVERLIGYARLRGMSNVAVSRQTAFRLFGLDDSATNHDLSLILAEYFAELQQILPPQRRFYDAEDERTNVFRSVAIGSAAMSYVNSKRQAS